ncbi:transglutaminaseTgpA domain-containing protein [Dactylosporangium sp. NPDC049525]|uniref:transglutaminaseTgpA domain-containing protein n=1 Tax=Dactylosporangium sp. NPDC049525 TaxID=3154730 RepID=UPI0034202B8C
MRRLLVAVALLGMLVMAAFALAPIYHGPLLLQLMAGAAAGSVGVSVAARRLPGWSAAPLSVVGLVGVVLLAMRVSAAAAGVDGSLPALREALRNSIPRLLLALIPIEPQPDTVLLPVILTWLTGLAAAELGVRYHRVLLSYAPPTVLFGAALYLVGPNGRSASWVPLAFAGFAALGLIVSNRPPPAEEDRLTEGQRRTLRLRVGAGAAAGLAAVVALSQLLGPSVAAKVGTSPAEPRNMVTPPQLDSLDESPLVRLSGWALNHDQHLFDVEVTGTDAPPPVRLAVLNDYDGVTWRVGATYRNAGRVVAGKPVLTDPQVRQVFRIADLDGRLLPGIATPEEVNGVRVAVDTTDGTMILSDGLRPGVQYSVISRVHRPDENAMQVADVPNTDAVARHLALPGKVPDSIAQLAQHLGEGVSSPYQKAFAIVGWLSEHYKAVGDAPSGHAYPNVEYFLFGPKQAGGQKGTSEQFAAAFAVLARLMGLPTRLAVGFRVEPGRNEVHGGDAVAWPEVLFNGVWEPFDPMPKADTVQRPTEDDFRPKPPASQPPPETVPAPSGSAASQSPKPTTAPTGDATGQDSSTGVTVAVAGGALLVTLMAFAAAVPLAKRTRRRRRLAQGTPAQRIDAAWAEVLTGLRLAGRPAPPHLTASEVAHYAAAAATARAHSKPRGVATIRSATPPVDDVAALINAVAFAGPQTIRGLPAGPGEEQATRAAVQAVAYVDELRARRGFWRRLRWTLDPRPLFWK